MTAPLLFIASDRREAEPWVSHWEQCQTPDLAVHWARAGKWKGRDVLAIANGVGPERAAGAVQAAAHGSNALSGICCIGTGGALDPSLRIGDIVVADSVHQTGARTQSLACKKPVWTTPDSRGPDARVGAVLTSPHIVRAAAEKTNLSATGAIIVEMEAAAVAQAASELAVPFYCIRVVSDLANQTFFIDFESFLMPDGRFDVPRLVMYALMHPFRGPAELLRLQRRTSIAAKNLGEFLNHCKF